MYAYKYWKYWCSFNALIIGHLNTLCTSNDICVCYVNHKIVATSIYSCQLIFHHSSYKTDFQKYEFIYITYYISNSVLVTVCTGLECVCLQSHRHIKIKTLQSLLCRHSHWVHAADQENISPQRSWLLSELRWFSAPVGTSCGLREGMCHFFLMPLHVILYHSNMRLNLT